MAPGGEFRRAAREAYWLTDKKECNIVLGDRPVNITLQRALGSLSLWQKLRLGWSLMTENFDVTQEQVEKMKNQDLLETLLLEMSKEFPTLAKVFIEERDVYLASYLAGLEAQSILANKSYLPIAIVAVVGIGHQPGILKQWDRIQSFSETEKDELFKDLLSVPPPSRLGQVVKMGFRAARVTLLVWGCYKLVKWVCKVVEVEV